MSEHPEEFHDDGEDLIAEIRAVRHRISAQFGHDPEKLIAHYIELQKAHPERLIRAPEDDVSSRSAA